MAAWFIVPHPAADGSRSARLAVDRPIARLPAALAVLVVTCPCALSLATPVAIAAATSRLARLGVLVTRADAIEGLAHVDTVVLDKTGTLTCGSARMLGDRAVAGARAIRRRWRSPRRSRRLASSARRRVPARMRAPALRCADALEVAGQGVEGSMMRASTLAARRVEFAAGLAPARPVRRRARAARAAATVALGDERACRPVSRSPTSCAPMPADRARPARPRARACASRAATASAGRAGRRELGMSRLRASCGPRQARAALQALQRDGHQRADDRRRHQRRPVLAAADVSLAMGKGSSMAHAAGDCCCCARRSARCPGQSHGAPHAHDRARRTCAGPRSTTSPRCRSRRSA